MCVSTAISGRWEVGGECGAERLANVENRRNAEFVYNNADRQLSGRDRNLA